MHRWLRVLTVAALAGISAGAGPRSPILRREEPHSPTRQSAKAASGGGVDGAVKNPSMTAALHLYACGGIPDRAAAGGARATPGTTTTPAPNRT